MAKKSIKPMARARAAVGSLGGALRPLTIMDLKELLGAALIDPAFRDRLLDDTSAVLREHGIEPAPGCEDFFAQLRDGSFTDAADMINTNSSPRPPIIDFIK